MVKENDLIDAVVTALRAIPAVVTALESTPTNVIAWKRTSPAATAGPAPMLQALNPPCIMVTHLRTFFSRQIDHQFSLILRTNGTVDDLFSAIREGVPTGYGGVKFKRAQIHTDCEPPFISTYEPRLFPISDSAFLEVYEATLSLKERGADI